MDYYSLKDKAEDYRWYIHDRAQEIIELEREEYKKIDKLFPENLEDFNPKDPKYSKYLNNDFAQERYSDFVYAIVEKSLKG